MIQTLKWFYRAWLYRLKLEKSEIAWLLSFLKAGQTTVDIGAHKGAYTWWLAKCVTKRGKVFAFEPQPDLAGRLKALMEARQLHHVKVEQMGISSVATELALRLPSRGNSPGASFEDTRDARGGQKVTVPVTTLDEYFATADRGPISLIKCDTEGHELEVFRGGARILQSQRPHLLFECEARHRGQGSTSEVFSYLLDLGYEGFFFDRTGLVPILNFDEALHQAEPGSKKYVNNFLFSHTEQA